MSRPTLGPTQTLQRVREVGDSPPASDEVKNDWRWTATPHIRLHGKNRNFSFFICRVDLPHYQSSALSHNVKIGSYWSVLQHACLRSSVDLNNAVCVCVCSHGNRVMANKRPHATQLSSWETQCSQHMSWPFPYLSWTLHDRRVCAPCQTEATTHGIDPSQTPWRWHNQQRSLDPQSSLAA